MFRRIALATLIALAGAPQPASAGWFGPSTRDECIEEYAQDASSKKLVRAVYSYCSTAFDPSYHRATREKSLCIAKNIGKLKTEYAFASLIQRCERESPEPTCPAGQKFIAKGSYCSCDNWQGYDLAPNRSCLKVCDTGHYLDSDKICWRKL